MFVYVTSPTRLRSRRGHRPQKLHLGLQGDPLLVNHLQSKKQKKKDTKKHDFWSVLFEQDM